MYFCLENIEVIININEINKYLYNLDTEDHLEISLKNLSDLYLNVNILDSKNQIKETHQLIKINNDKVEKISIVLFKFEISYQIQSKYLKDLINFLHSISLRKCIDTEIDYNKVTFRTYGIFKYLERLEIQDYIANILNSNYSIKCKTQNFDICLERINRKKTNHQFINQIPIDIWNKIFQYSFNLRDDTCYDKIDLILTDNLEGDKLTPNLNHYNKFVKSFDSSKLKSLINLSLNLNCDNLINLFLLEKTALVLNHNISKFGCFRSILAPLNSEY